MSRVLRTVAVATITTTLVLLPVGLAEAHVQVIPESTAAGTESTKLVFRVPTESARAGTVSLRIDLPTATPFAEVLAEPLPNWTVTVTTGKLPKPVDLDGTTLTEAPTSVTWTTTKAHEVGPGQFQEFALSAGPIPAAKELSFPATQTYSDGTVVKWNEPQPAGADEPEHPLPSFAVTVTAATAATADSDPGAGAPSAPATTAPAQTGTQAAPASDDSEDGDAVSRGLATGGLAAALVALVLAALAWRTASRNR